MVEEKTTEEMLEIIHSLVNQTSQRQAAKQIGITVQALSQLLKNKTVSNKVAEFFGYQKITIYRSAK